MDALYLTIGLAFFWLGIVCVQRVFPAFQP
jgi:hypothetical protein